MRTPLKAWYFRSPIDLKKLAARFPESTGNGSDALLISLDEGHQVCVCDFGGVVFWPFEPELAEQVSREIQEVIDDPSRVEEVEDRLVVETHKGENRVLFDEVWLAGHPRPDQIIVISQLLAQSVALEHLELEVDDALERFGIYIRELREKGRVRMSTGKILQSIGFAMQTRQAVIGNLALFDKPEATWESEELERLYLRLYDYFELEERQESISLKLDFLADNTSLLFDFLSTRRSLQLEWTIVVLIAAEILLFVLYELLR